jgi:lipopolysaccharide export system protein LptA
VPLRPHPQGPVARLFGRGVACTLAGITLAAAQSLRFQDDPDDPGPARSGGLLNADLMPDGGILKNVLIPQYNDDLSLSATLRAGEMKISVEKIDEKIQVKRIDALGVNLDFFNPDQSPRGAIAMATARYDALKQLLKSDEPVSLVSEDLTAKGSRLDYDLKNSRGFLHGPVTAVVTADPSTTMNTRPLRQTLAAGALLAATGAPLPAQQAPAAPVAERIAEARLGPEEIARIEKDSASARPAVEAAAGEAGRAIDDTTAQAEEADAAMADLLRHAELTALAGKDGPATPSGDVPRPDLPAKPTTTRITSDDGAFFDSKNGLLIFLKNVVVTDPRFNLSATDEVKVFFEPKETPAKAAPKAPAEGAAAPAPEAVQPPGTVPPSKPPAAKAVAEDKPGLADASFGKPSRIVATGTVVVEYRSDNPKEAPVKASARTVIYDLKKEEFILRGGSPWVLREGQVSSVPGNDAYIVVQKDGSFVTGNGGIDARMDIKDSGDDKKRR